MSRCNSSESLKNLVSDILPIVMTRSSPLAWYIQNSSISGSEIKHSTVTSSPLKIPIFGLRVVIVGTIEIKFDVKCYINTYNY